VSKVIETNISYTQKPEDFRLKLSESAVYYSTSQVNRTQCEVAAPAAFKFPPKVSLSVRQASCLDSSQIVTVGLKRPLLARNGPI